MNNNPTAPPQIFESPDGKRWRLAGTDADGSRLFVPEQCDPTQVARWVWAKEAELASTIGDLVPADAARTTSSPSPTPAERLALKTAHAALLNSPNPGYDLVSTVVFALGSAGLLMDPETAEELRRLRAAAGTGATRPVDEDPIAYALTEKADRQDWRREESVVKLRDLLARQQEDSYMSPLHHDYRIPHDLPEVTS